MDVLELLTLTLRAANTNTKDLNRGSIGRNFSETLNWVHVVKFQIVGLQTQSLIWIHKYEDPC